MPLFLCRWLNGDCSVVWARNTDEAIIELDQIANAEGCPVAEVQTYRRRVGRRRLRRVREPAGGKAFSHYACG